ncbi:multiple sugar transport system permease protein [Candidatus Hakubella thermalkaliphila]|uniref:Multiple sugar transport system permease protein n=2 Tax=Candidatus Hakubella thermalkaliphila TaxID=2754717 RepID=A0A6V8NZT6_9ACTN|nr:sugar ABC transporter permease [Candidatus Hakubella thermalkaliphila]MBT9167398.1 Lactose transport system permease protein LacF [Bacillota bacterium]GFP24924.1 multiple sugar transport system permease protein [Candidatus Hakubella thermalkaliphila]GFP34816.1 multiple sugar transport system permease protein [Candidatus Hakubella thermalkaliphila]GFP42584.1 multiple sugar transport system permease protein [Candidatus Hakubella thermalkaliphila]
MAVVGKTKRKIILNVTGYLFIAPLLIYFVVFQVVPVFMAFYYSFTNWSIGHSAQWIGLKNYLDLFFNRVSYPYFWKSLGTTLRFVGLAVTGTLFASLFVALLLNTDIKRSAFFRIAFFMPYVTSTVAVAAIWKWLYDPLYGLLNYLLSLIIPNFQNVAWLKEERYALAAFAVMVIWQGAGYYMMIFLARLKSIPDEYYEAARIDGANTWQSFWHVTWPMLRPATFYVLVTLFIVSFQVFDIIYILTKGLGDPNKSTLTYVLQLFNHAFRYNEMGVASAMSFILFIIIIVVTAIQFKVVPQDVE